MATSTTYGALRGLRDSWLTPYPGGCRDAVADFGSPQGRDARYRLLWGFYANDAYSDDTLGPGGSAGYGGLAASGVGRAFKEKRGLYRHIRNLYNPSYRLAEFYAGKLMGGGLDPEAGDGEEEQSALPIVAESDAIRPGLSTLWRDSRWGSAKDLYCRFGAVFGDAVLMVEDDPTNMKVRLCVVPPGEVVWAGRDPATGDVTGYVRHQWRDDPRPEAMRDRGIIPARRVLYREEATLQGERVAYRTMLDGEPYDWSGNGPEWEVDLPFVPMVLVQHETFGGDWGLSCLHAGLSRFAEVDDQASGLSDQVRKAIRAPHLLTGISAPKTIILPRGYEPTPEEANRRYYDEDQSDRDALPFLYGPKDAGATSLVFPLDIAGVVAHIEALLADVESNYPELMTDVATSSGDASGRALRVARQVASSKVQARRAAYDEGLVLAHRMALAIGGRRRYPGYEGMPPERDDPKLDHRIGQREVFSVDPMDEMEAEGMALANVKAAVDAGIPLERALVQFLAMEPDEAAKIAADKEKADEEKRARFEAMTQGAGAGTKMGPDGRPVPVPTPNGVPAGLNGAGAGK